MLLYVQCLIYGNQTFNSYYLDMAYGDVLKKEHIFSEEYKWHKLDVIMKTMDLSSTLWENIEDVYYWYIDKELKWWRDNGHVALWFLKWFICWKKEWYNDAKEEVRKTLWFPDCSDCEYN